MDRDRLKKLAEERWMRRVVRKGKQYSPVEIGRKQRGQWYGYRSKILDLYTPFVPFSDRKQLSQAWLTVPKKFSLSHNPVETIAFFRKVVEYARSAKRPRLQIDHRQVEYLGLAADNVLGMLLKEISWECRGRRGYGLRGWKADKPEARKMMERIGCVRAVTDDPTRPSGEGELDLDLKTKGHVFRYRNSKFISTNGIVADGKTKMVEHFADHLDACLDNAGKRLSAEGKGDLSEYLGEVVSNAEDHSGLNEWLVCGYIDSDESELVYRCTVISFGETFASTFLSLPEDAYARQDVQLYVDMHQRKKLFSVGWRAEDLVAVVALQGDISSKNVDTSSTRGQGTVDFLEFFSKISNSCLGNGVDATMGLLSGRTLISFDGTYHIQEPSPGARKVIAFNAENDLTVRPDPKAVRALSGEGFPGVVMSISAPLTSDMVEQAHESEHEN